MHLEHDLDRGPHLLANRGHDVDRTAALVVRQLGVGCTERIELERAVASRNDCGRKVGNDLGLALGLVPAVGVGRDALVKASAEELVDGDTQRLPHDVPAGHVEDRQRGGADFTGAAVLGHLDVPGESLDVERIAADDIARGELAQARDQGLGLVDHTRFAEADQAFIGHELDERELAPWRPHHGDLHVDNLHVLPTASG